MRAVGLDICFVELRIARADRTQRCGTTVVLSDGENVRYCSSSGEAISEHCW